MRFLSYYITASIAACFGAAIMALLIAGARADREMEKRDECDR